MICSSTNVHSVNKLKREWKAALITGSIFWEMISPILRKNICLLMCCFIFIHLSIFIPSCSATQGFELGHQGDRYVDLGNLWIISNQNWDTFCTTQLCWHLSFSSQCYFSYCIKWVLKMLFIHLISLKSFLCISIKNLMCKVKWCTWIRDWFFSIRSPNTWKKNLYYINVQCQLTVGSKMAASFSLLLSKWQQVLNKQSEYMMAVLKHFDLQNKRLNVGCVRVKWYISTRLAESAQACEC